MPTAHSSGHSGQWWLWLLLSVVLLVSPPTGPAPVSAVEPAGLEFFEQKIRPLLVERCHACHSSQTASPQGGLRLDTRDGLLKGGDSGPAIVPGKPNRSLLIAAVRHQDRVMPPKGPALTAPQIADLVAWVEQGAPPARNPSPLPCRTRPAGGPSVVGLPAAGHHDAPVDPGPGLGPLDTRPACPGSSGGGRINPRPPCRSTEPAAPGHLGSHRPVPHSGRDRAVPGRLRPRCL